jgi:ubiquinone/menaquinone biosynthesis C-methylase UbiE
MEAMLAQVDPVLIQALHLDAPYRIADVACGGGGTTLEILRRSPANTIVHGFDISPTLIEVARARTLPSERSIGFEVANMATAPAPEEPYDRLASRFEAVLPKPWTAVEVSQVLRRVIVVDRDRMSG